MLLLFAKYGWKELIAFSLLWCGLGVLLWFVHPIARYAIPVAVAGLILTLSFFRDPPRRVPDGPGLLVSPADGTVVEVSEVDDDEYLKAPCHKIGIFLSIFNVHVNRSPCQGTVRAVKHKPGRYLDARHPDCALLNESNTVHIGDVVVKQIAGLIARRIVCRTEPNDVLERGQRFGMIKFGSRTELYIPKQNVEELRVRLKDKVKGGETVIAKTRQ